MDFKIIENKLLIDDKEFGIQDIVFVEEIGKGANAKVFRVRNSLLDRYEAIKIWVERKRSDSVDIKRFNNEVSKNANIEIAGVASFYDAKIEAGVYYARLQYIEGKTLKEYLEHKPEFALRVDVLNKILKTLDKVYKKGYFHGDLHNRNIIVNCNEPTIIDFGTSVFSGQDKSHERDCRMLVNLCYEIVPEFKRINFLEKEVLLKQTSAEVLKLMMVCLDIVWDFVNIRSLHFDDYSNKSWKFKLDIIGEEYSFIDCNKIEEFFLYEIETVKSKSK